MDDSDIFDPFDMDREEFNVDMCMLRYSRECSLQNLLSRKNYIDQEIRTFNCDLQNLLCDNYQKFLNASSVVSGIKDNFQTIGEEMDKLSEKMNLVGGTSSKILEKLRPCEERISRLLKCQKGMRKLVLLTDLVPTLKSYVESGAHTAAARYYLKAENVLKKYESLSSLNCILKKCSEIVAEIKLELKSKLNCEIYRREEVSETLRLLLTLREEPLSVMKHFLACCNQSLICVSVSMDETWAKLSKQNNKELILREISNYTSLCCKYVERLSMIIGLAKDVFVLRNNVDMELCVNQPLQIFFTENMDRLASKWLNHIKEKFHDIEDEFLSQCLDKFVRECHTSGYLTSRINVYEQGIDIILKVCAARCEYHLKKIEEDFKSQLLKHRYELSICLNLRNLTVILKEWTVQRLIAVLKSLTCYIHPECRCCREVFFRKVFCKVIVREGLFVKFFRYITHETWSLTSSPEFHQQTKTLSCIVFTKYLSDLKQDIVFDFFEKVDNHFSSTTEGLCLTNAEDLIAELSHAAQKILEFYIRIRHESIADMIQKSTENKNWMDSIKEPTKPRAVVKMVLNDIRETKIETEKVFGPGNFARKQISDLERVIFFSSPSSLHGLPKTNTLEERLLLSRVFAGVSDLSTRVEPKTTSILTCLLSKILKSFMECVRLKTYNNFSLQQIQLDVCYLQFHVCQLIDANMNIQSLFDDIIASAYNRTPKPKLMHSKVISAICRSDI